MIIKEIKELLKNINKDEKIQILLIKEHNSGVSIPYGAEITEIEDYIKVQPNKPQIKMEEDIITVDSEKEYPYYFRKKDIMYVGVTSADDNPLLELLQAMKH